MRLALLGPAHPYRGGIAHHTAHVMRAFEDAGAETRVYNFKRQYPRLLFPGRRQTDTSRRPLVVPGERSVDSLNPLSWVMTARRIRAFRPDVLLVQWWHPFFAPSYGTIARIVRRGGATRVVFLCHNVRPHESSLADVGLLRYAYKAADAFIVQAGAEADRLTELLGVRPPLEVVTHPSYDGFRDGATELTREQARERLGLGPQRLVLFFGLVRKYKGLDVLIEALARVRDTSTQLLVAGEFYDGFERYAELVKRLGLSDRVRLEDRYIPNEDVATHFRAADLVALPYRTATQSGIVQVAYALGTPVVVSAVGGIPEVVEDGVNGLLVPAEQPRALAEAIDRFFDEDLGDAMRTAINERRGTREWHELVAAIERLSHTVAS